MLLLNVILILSVLENHVLAQTNLTYQQIINAQRTLSIGAVIFPGFQPLDLYGPLSVLHGISSTYQMTLSIISTRTGPVSFGVPPFSRGDFGFMIGAETVATHTFETAPALDMILVPGGWGSAVMIEQNNTGIEDFVARRFNMTDYVLSVCTGAVHLARSGILNGQPATTNKAQWRYFTQLAASYRAENVEWRPSARWVNSHEGKVWTSSGVAAGIDMIHEWLKHAYGDTKALRNVMNGIEYAPHTDSHWDPFSVVHDVPGAETSRNLTGCVTPVGY